MKAIVSLILLITLAAALALPLAENSALAQAPTGPQGGASPPPQQQQKPEQPQSSTPAQQPPQAGVTIAVDVPIVTLDVVATTQHGDIIPNLKKENFRVFDDGVAQTITNFAPTEAPITTVMLLEFSSRGYYSFFSYYSRYWSDAFLPQLQQKDWVALETFDMKTHIETDFTQNKDDVFDAILETVDRLKDVNGKKSILVLASGVDTFSKHTLDQTMKQLRGSDVTIFCVGLGKIYTNFLETHGSLGSHLNYLQAENQLRTFANETGGYAWFPQFDGEIPGIMQSVAAFLRHQYSLSYSPTNGVKDGKFHKIKVELVAPDGGPLTVVDQKGKKQKFQVYAREGYQAPKGGVGD
jgi:hypothetical protein